MSFDLCIQTIVTFVKTFGNIVNTKVRCVCVVVWAVVSEVRCMHSVCIDRSRKVPAGGVACVQVSATDK